MKRIRKASAWILISCMCLGVLGTPLQAAAATKSNLSYVFNDTTASAENDMFVYKNSIVTGPLDPATLDGTKGTHYYAGAGNFSRYSSAHVWAEGNSGEAPVCYDETGKPYYVQATPATMESYGLYVDDYYMGGKHIEEKTYARWDYIQQFVLADTSSGEVTTCYCADQITSTQKGYYYNIENLEDADYYEPAQARKIRSIALNGYWGTDSGLGSLASMKSKLAASGQFTDEELSRLTDGVAMTATQYAIWSFSNINTGTRIISSYYTDENVNDNWGIRRVNAEQKKSVDLIFKVYDYLLNLNPTSLEETTEETIINKDNFLKNIGITAVEKIADHENNKDTNKDNDAYLADLSFTMAVLPDADDNLAAKVIDSEGNVLAVGRIAGSLQDGEIALEKEGNGKYTFKGLEMTEGNQLFSILIEGIQQLKRGVYLYTSEVKGTTSSQTLVGIAEGAHEVDQELTWNVNFSVEEDGPDRVINLHKKSTDGKGLEGIEFDVYFVADRADYLSGKVKLPEAEKYQYDGVANYTIVTDSSGNGTLNLTENYMADGVYLIVEKEHPAVVAPVEPFYVILPATSDDGKELVYTVDITPKNQVRGDVTIEKDVISIGNDHSTQDAYKSHTWIIGTSIPADIGKGKSFVISDTLDPRLDYVGNVRVRVENTTGSLVTAVLTEGTDYILTVNDVNSVESGASDSFTVSLTKAGREKVASAIATGISHIRVYFDAKINANAELGEEIPNQASLHYENSVGVDFNVKSDIPEVHTGGSSLVKVDAGNKELTLFGAEFVLYRPATARELTDESVAKVQIGEMETLMVEAEFFNNTELSGDKVTTIVTDKNGKAYMYGLAYGTYYLVETKAPAGYNLTNDPIEIIIDEDSHFETNTLIVENYSGAMLPETGGMGTTAFTMAGMMLMLGAGVLLVTRRRMRAE